MSDQDSSQGHNNSKTEENIPILPKNEPDEFEKRNMHKVSHHEGNFCA